MPGTSLVKRDWEEGMVYLVQFPRTGSTPSPSPFALKLETWLRINDIPYTNISNNFTKTSSKGQIPFIEFNGRQIPDSNQIIHYLKQQLHKSEGEWLSESDKAIGHAYHALIEDSLRWVLFYQRGRNASWIASTDGFSGNVKGLKKIGLSLIGVRNIKSYLAKATHFQGIGRHSLEEVVAIAKRDLDSISAFLGDKSFIQGEKPTTLDAIAFGHIAQFYWGPVLNEEIKNYIEQKTPNIAAYLKKMREKYWPDWEEIISTLNMNTKWK